MKKVILYLLVFLLALSACGVQPTGVPDKKILVTVSIPPQAWVVEQIGGDLVSVQAMAGPSDDPHTYEPKPAQMAALAGTELYLTIGVEFEQAWLPRFSASNPKMSVEDSAAGITRMPMVSSIQLGVTGTQEGEQGMLDPHVWLSPALLKQIAENTAAALAALHPESAASFEDNLAALEVQIDQVDQQVRNTLQGITRNHFMIIHPALGYFAREYGLTMLPVEVGGQEPGPEQLAALLDLAREYQVSVLFTQPGFSTKMAESIASQIGAAQVVTLDPMARDWPANMLAMAKALEGALK